VRQRFGPRKWLALAQKEEHPIEDRASCRSGTRLERLIGIRPHICQVEDRVPMCTSRITEIV
jgi:hypothetical protein